MDNLSLLNIEVGDTVRIKSSDLSRDLTGQVGQVVGVDSNGIRIEIKNWRFSAEKCGSFDVQRVATIKIAPAEFTSIFSFVEAIDD